MSDEESDSKVHHVVLHKARKQWYKRVWVWIMILLVLGVIGAAAGGGDGTTVTTTANQPTATSKHDDTSNSPGPEPTTTAHVGATISLKDQDGDTMDVTLVKVVDPASGADGFTTPENGKRFIGIQFKIANTSTNSLSEDADNDATLFDTESQTYSTDVDSLSNCPGFALSAKLSVGSSELGCVAFQVPIGTKVAKAQFTPSSGFSGGSGEWLIP